MKGKFIVLDGPDGSGKSTVAKGLKKYYNNKKWPVLFTREPGGTPLGEAVRKMLLDLKEDGPTDRAEALLFAAARAQHADTVIRPALESGKDVISDRYILSSLAYQGIGRELGVAPVEAINNFAIDGLLPDLTLFILVDPKQGILRKNGHKELDRIEEAGNEFHKRVSIGYQRLAESHRHHNLVVIDGNQSKEEVLKACIEAIDQLKQRRTTP